MTNEWSSIELARQDCRFCSSRFEDKPDEIYFYWSATYGETKYWKVGMYADYVKDRKLSNKKLGK